LSDPPAPFIPTDMFALPDDLEVTLWAKSPAFRNPSNMDIDAQGRIWVTEAYNYRRHAGRDPAGDRVMILEDTDGDGKADKSRVFVQETALLAPLGIAVIDNKVIVSCAPDIIIYTDVFGTEVRSTVTSAVLSRASWPIAYSLLGDLWSDGKYYFNHGNAGASSPTSRDAPSGCSHCDRRRAAATLRQQWRRPISPDGRRRQPV
jgi:putative membrane-bound dehydrogenase-like protein